MQDDFILILSNYSHLECSSSLCEMTNIRCFFSKKMTKLPNILVTGTPGTGKTTTASMIAASLNLHHIDLTSIVKQHSLHSGYDTQFESYILDEDLVVDHLEVQMTRGGVCLDHHGSDFFPLRWFQLVVVLTCSTEVLWSRLEERNYSQSKIQENVECEIMNVCLEEAVSGFGKEKCLVLKSETIKDMEDNVEKVEDWFENYIKSRDED